MALEDTGVRFIGENFSKFLSMMADAAKAVSKFGNITTETSEKLNNLSKNFEAMSIDVDTLTGSLNDALADLGATFASMDEGAQEGILSLASHLGDGFDKLKSTLKGKAGKIIPDVFKTILNSVKTGASIGGSIGTAIGLITTAITSALGTPIVGLPAGLSLTFLTSLQGALIGALAGLSAGVANAAIQAGKNIINAIGNMLNSIGNFVVQTLPGILGKIANVGMSIAKTLFSIGKTVVSAAFNVVKSITGAIGNFFKSILGLFMGGGAGYGGWRSLGDTIFSAMFKFEILKQAIRKVIDVLKTFAKESFNAAAELQVLNARMTNIIATQVRITGLTDDYAQSVSIAGGYTQDLTRWIQKLALETPVSIEDVSTITYLSLAMGWGVKGAKDLTKAIVDYTAALGMGSEISERIIYNFAQMKQQGKVTGTELRDLGRGAYMPINDILGVMYKNLKNSNDAMGKTTQSFSQFREEAAAGKVSVEGFFQAFQDFVSTNMPNMAYKMNYTFAAVKQNISDLTKVLLGWNVFGPMIQSITAPFQRLIKSLQTDEVLAKFNAIGKALATVIQAMQIGLSRIGQAIGNVFKALGIVAPSIESVIKSIIKFGMLLQEIGGIIADFINTHIVPFAKEIGNKVGGTFKNMSKDFFTWGFETMVSFAKGMVEGAARAITAAIKWITKLLTSWFKGHSPPKILPDIDKWGMDTINEWLHGFTQADFDVLDDLQGIVKDTLGALENLGVITGAEAAQEFVDISIQLMQSFDEFNKTGKVSGDIFERLRNIGGAYGQEVAELLDLQLQHVVALERATIAERAYDNAVKSRTKSEAKVGQLVRDYNTLLRKGADKNTLKNKLKIVNAAQLQLDVDAKAELTKKDELDIAKEQLSVIEDQVKLQESLIKQMIELAQAQKEAAGGGAAAMEETLSDLNTLIGGLGDVDLSGFKIDFEKLYIEAMKEFDILFNKTLPDMWNDAWYNNFINPDSEFQKAWKELVPIIQPYLDKLKAAWDKFAKSIGLPSISDMLSAWTSVPATKQVEGQVPMTEQDVMDFVARNPGKPVPATKPGMITVSNWTAQLNAVLQEWIKDIKVNGGILATLGEIAGYIWTNLVSSVKALFTDPQKRQEIKDAFNGFMTWLTDLVLGDEANVDVGGNGKMAKKNIGWTDRWVQQFYTMGENIGQGIIDGITNKISTYDWNINVWGLIQNSFIAFFDLAKFVSGLFFGNGTMLVDGLTGGIVNGISTFDWVKKAWELITTNFKNFFKIGSPSKLFEGYGTDIIDGLKDGIVNTINSFIGPEGALTTAFNGLVNGIKSLFGLGDKANENPFIDIGRAIMEGILAGIKEKYNQLRDTLMKYGVQLPDLFAEKEKIKSPSKVFAEIGRNMMLGLRKGIVDTSALVNKSLIGSINNTMLQPKISAPMSATPVYGGATVNFGDVTINNGMDWAVFKAQVQRAMVEG